MPDPSPPDIGELNLFSSVRPPLSAGKYKVEMSQTIDAGGQIAPVERHIELDAPRFTLPSTEVHSVFPPPNERGPFENRLAQIALGRRTLPWERGADAAPLETRSPWLALVLLASGEANFVSGVAIADAITAEAREALKITETGTCDTVEVSATVVKKVFPREEELDLLCHVRQVNLGDTEYAGSDDDGFVAIVLSNRLPQPGQRYGAYLISLEGQLAELPGDTTRVANSSSPDRSSRGFAMKAGPVFEVGDARVYDTDDETLSGLSHASTGRPIELIETEQPDFGREEGASSETHSPWSAEQDVRLLATAASGTGFVRHAMDFDALHVALKLPPPRLLRFPVLAHWSFECSGDGDFQSLMQRLDTGLLGTQPKNAPTEAEPTFQAADTGHTVVDHVGRRGEWGRAWYRGPFSPRQVARRGAARPYHVADQARRIADDGLEDVSEAAAFELGRLLALASGEYARLLQDWRRAGIDLRRMAKAIETVPTLHAQALAENGKPLGRRLGLDLLTEVSKTEALGAGVPATDAGVQALLENATLSELAAGLELPQEYVSEVLSPDVTELSMPREPFKRRLETDFERIVEHDPRLGSLATALDASAEEADTNAGVPRRPTRTYRDMHR